jgi:hypothetical protein
MIRTTIALLAAAAMFGAVSAAQAGSKSDGDSAGASSGSSGFRVGPGGQPMGGPMAWRGRPRSVYAYVPRAGLDRHWYYENGYGRRVIR